MQGEIQGGKRAAEVWLELGNPRHRGPQEGTCRAKDPDAVRRRIRVLLRKDGEIDAHDGQSRQDVPVQILVRQVGQRPGDGLGRCHGLCCSSMSAAG